MSKSEYHFKIWRQKVKKRLPEMVTKFYTQNHPAEIHKKLGDIISDINNPFFGIMYEGKKLKKNDKIAFQIILELNVEEIFKKIMTYE